MARRRSESPLFSLLADSPIWLGPIIAAAGFALLRWVAPWGLTVIGGSDAFGKSLMGTLALFSHAVAPWVCAFTLVVWIAAEIKKRLDGHRLERQTGAGSIRALSWREFELLLAEAFRREGFAVEHTGELGPDGGIDLRLDKAGAVTLVQCKHWKERQVGVRIVRELLGVVSSERAQSGIVVTSGLFTPEAAAFAATNPIRLIDGRELVSMIGAVQKSGRVQGREHGAATATPSTPAPPDSSASAVTCPNCGAAMVRRVARKGPDAGSEFYGCSRYPDCRGTRALEASSGQRGAST